jgi:O-antigen ligase
LSDWFFLAAVLGVLPVLILHDKIEVPFPKLLLIGLGLLVVGGLLSTPGAQWPVSSLFSLLKMVYLIGIWFSVGIILLRRTEDIQNVMMFWAISAAVTSAAAAAQLIWGDIIPRTSPSWGRMTGFAEHVNDLGGITSIALVPALCIATIDEQRTWLTLSFWPIACLILSGLVWSGSISSILAASVALFIWMVLRKRGLRHVLLLIIGSGAIVVLVHLISTAKVEEPKTVVAKIERPTTDKVETERSKSEGPKTGKTKTDDAKIEEAKPESIKSEKAKAESALTEKEKAEKAVIKRSRNYRVKRDEPPMLIARLFQLKEKTAGFETIRSRFNHYQKTWESITQNIFVGVGIGPWNGRFETGQLVHNLFLNSWYEGGLFALLGILILFGAIAKSGIDIIKSPVWPIRLMGISLFSALCAFLVQAMAQPIYYKRFQWFPALLLLAVYSIHKAKRDLA